MGIIGRTLFAAICSIVLAAGAVRAQAPYEYPVGTVSACIATGTSITQFGDIPFSGVGTFETIADNQTNVAQLRAVAFQASGFDPALGEVVWKLDLDRTEEDGLTSEITANQSGEALPATATLRFHAQITLSNEPGKLYLSQQPIVMVSDEILKWPYTDVNYTQAEPVVFEEVDNPGDVIEVMGMTTSLTCRSCRDAGCQTDGLTLNTGFDVEAGDIYHPGQEDGYWTIVADDNMFRPRPRPANVIDQDGSWAPPLPNSQWIGANESAYDESLGSVTYRKCFCLCRESVIAFTMSVLADDYAEIYVDGIHMGTTENPGLDIPTEFEFSIPMSPGSHCIEVVVVNTYITQAGLNIQGEITGAGLLKYNCCNPKPAGTPQQTPQTPDGFELATGSN